MWKKATLAAALTGLCSAQAGAADDAALDDLRRTVQQQQQDITTLKQRLNATADQVSQGMGADSTTIGGYGELHYNNLDSKKELDFHRFVLFFGHQFSDTIRFHSELELEHSLVDEDEKGELELEQAYIDFDLNDRHTARAGLFLVPVGILNETHEPPTFYGVERNPVESNIIPTTWWEGGGGLHGELAPGVKYDAAVTSGLNVPTSGANAFKVRDGRQKVAKAVAENLAYTARLRWTGMPGLELAGTLHYQDDVTQSQGAEAVSATLLEAHAIVSRGPFGLRALYATWQLDGNAPAAVGRDEQSGWYLEPSYRFNPMVGVFARYSSWDNEAGDSADSEKNQTNVGVNFWPHENVVLKADIQTQGGAASDDGFNLGLGYQF